VTVSVPELLAALGAFVQEHLCCGELESGIGGTGRGGQRVELTSGRPGGLGLALRLPPALALAVVRLSDLQPAERPAARATGARASLSVPARSATDGTRHTGNPADGRTVGRSFDLGSGSAGRGGSARPWRSSLVHGRSTNSEPTAEGSLARLANCQDHYVSLHGLRPRLRTR
jgi:hypothetical protein